MNTTTLEDFYKETSRLIPADINKEIGHFNVFQTDELAARLKQKPGVMPYNRRNYYKISLVRGHNIAEYADKVIEINSNMLLFATPRIPYNWVPQNDQQSGYFCIFTPEFLVRNKSGVVLEELPIYQPGGVPVFQLSDGDADEVERVFRKMYDELSSNYAYKYDLLRNYVLELIHYGQKLNPAMASHPAHNAAARVSSLFVELLERQFPIESPGQRLGLRTANDFASRLAVHVNHLNKVLKENTGKTTTQLIGNRIAQEARILLK